jgi:hypothetical protein
MKVLIAEAIAGVKKAQISPAFKEPPAIFFGIQASISIEGQDKAKVDEEVFLKSKSSMETNRFSRFTLYFPGARFLCLVMVDFNFFRPGGNSLSRIPGCSQFGKEVIS